MVEALLSFGTRRGAIGSFAPVRGRGDQSFDIKLVVKLITAEGFKQLEDRGNL